MKAYISVSYNNRKNVAEVLHAIAEVLQKAGITPFVFVDVYSFSAAEEKEMMAQALRHIDSCDLLIAEVSEKAIGIGIEAGYAKAKGKPVIYIRNSNAAHSTTLSGVSDYPVIYDNTEDLSKKLRIALDQITDK